MLKLTSARERLYLNKLNFNFCLITALILLLSIFHVMYRFDWIDDDIRAPENSWNQSWLLLLCIDIAISLYWLNGNREMSNEEKIDNKSYKNSMLTPELVIEYKESIVTYFEDTQAYLSPNLSLDLLSQELCISKHHLSQLFNVYFECCFHHFVADFRILHAIELLKANQGKLKIETLAHSCGFNSKTPFNRYFKERIGFTPSAYMQQLAQEST